MASSSFKSSSSSSNFRSWKKSKDPSSTPLSFSQWMQQVYYHPNQILYYRIEFDQRNNSYLFTKDNDYNTLFSHPTFYVFLDEILQQKDEIAEEGNIFLDRLQLSQPGMEMRSSTENEVDRKSLEWLHTEASLIKYLKVNSEYWRSDGIHYRFKKGYIEMASLGALSKLILLGKVDQMEELCETLNGINQNRRKNKFQNIEQSIALRGDDADYFLALPLHFFKGSFRVVKDWLEQAFADLILKDYELSTIVSGGISYQHHTHLEWTAMGAQYPWCITEQAKSRQWLQTYLEDYSEHPIPFWLQDNQSTENSPSTDSDYAVFVTVAVYSDAVVFSIPAGKRALNETCLECLLREVFEETLLTFEAKPSSCSYSLSAQDTHASAQRIEFSESCHQLYHFRPNNGTDTFLFLYGETRK